MTPLLGILLRLGVHASCLFCALWSLPDRPRREMLHTDFRREMPRSGAFAQGRLGTKSTSTLSVLNRWSEINDSCKSRTLVNWTTPSQEVAVVRDWNC